MNGIGPLNIKDIGYENICQTFRFRLNLKGRFIIVLVSDLFPSWSKNGEQEWGARVGDQGLDEQRVQRFPHRCPYCDQLISYEAFDLKEGENPIQCPSCQKTYIKVISGPLEDKAG